MAYRRKHDRDQPRGWFNLFIRMGGWVALVLGAVLVVLTLISATQEGIADRLDRDGKFSRALVMDKRFTISTDDEGGESYTYYTTFRFKTSVGGGQELERTVHGNFYENTKIGDEHTIRYLRSDPTVFEYELDLYRNNSNIVRWIGLFFGVGGLLTLWFFGLKTNVALIARRDGEKRFAQVTGIAETNVEINEKAQARLVWREEDGQVGESFMRDRMELSRLYKLGDKIVVFRLGEKAFWEGDVGPPKREMPDGN